MRTESRTDRPTTETPWPRIRTAALPPSAFARLRPCCRLRTSMSVSPKSSRISQTGTWPPMPPAVWITCRIGVFVTEYGMISWAWLWTTRINIGAGLEDCAMDRAFAVHHPSTLIDWIAVEVEFHNVVERHQFGAARPRHKEPVGPLGMPKADVTKSIHDVFVGQDTVSDDEIFEMGLQSSHLASPRVSARVFESKTTSAAGANCIAV